MKNLFYLLLLINSICLAYSPINFDTKLVLVGIVIQQNTQVPIPNATVVLVEMNTGSRNQVITTANGQFYFKLEVDKNYNLILIDSNGEKIDTKNISTINKSDPEVLHAILQYAIAESPPSIKYDKFDIKEQMPYAKEVK
jgi:hypothetical protein